MTTGRLTRQEIGWLLAQEARGAAKVLRQDVTILSQSSVPPAPTSAVQREGSVEMTLNALDDAIGMLSELQSGAPKPGRRGRIDVAALLCELSPSASISLEPGAGTEVFGEETELRRMLHVLVSQPNLGPGQSEASPAAVRVRREKDLVRITVDLGPDASSGMEIERRWLARMATRAGGTVELEGGALSVLLPADASANKGEVEDLRKELAQAQQLGATYARELAAAFAAGLPESLPGSDPHDVAVRRFQLLTAVARAVHRVLSPILRGAHEEAQQLGNDATARSLSLLLDPANELTSELSRVAACGTGPMEAVDLATVMRDTVAQAGPRAAHHGVNLDSDIANEVVVSARLQALGLLLRCVVDHAIAATPKGGTVGITVRRDGSEALVSVRDGGPVVPASAHADLLEHRVDPASFGRPPGIGLLSASVTAAYLGTTLVIRESSDGGPAALAVEVRFELGTPSRKSANLC